jgi:hypothetical protein
MKRVFPRAIMALSVLAAVPTVAAVADPYEQTPGVQGWLDRWRLSLLVSF